ncbi:MAG: ABC transporter substrate-binding protein [Pseudomonadota bacterium]
MLRFLVALFLTTSVLTAQTDTTVEEQPVSNLDSPAKKVVFSMLDGFKKMASSRQRYLDGKQSYADYMKKDRTLFEEVSTTIDFYDVCEKSLRYDYDVKKKKFRKDHWVGRTSEDKKFFVKLFRELIEEIVYPIANEFFGELEMRHEVASVAKDDVHLRTIVKNVKKKKKRANEFVVDWYLHPKAEGGWIIYDIGVEGERWVPGFRSQFNDVISQKSYKELLRMMKKKLKETKEDRFDDDKKDFAAARKK